MKLTVIGSGYVGLVTGACLADTGNEGVGPDINAAKVKGASAKVGAIPACEMPSTTTMPLVT